MLAKTLSTLAPRRLTAQSVIDAGTTRLLAACLVAASLCIVGVTTTRAQTISPSFNCRPC